MKGEWEDIVNRVAKSVVGEKTIVCSKSAGIMKYKPQARSV